MNEFIETGMSDDEKAALETRKVAKAAAEKFFSEILKGGNSKEAEYTRHLLAYLGVDLPANG